MFIWNENRIRWGIICNETNKLDSVKTNIIKDYIKNKNVLDAGCGLGYLSLEMSKHANNVIAIDMDKNALFVLKKNIEKRKINNIIAVKTDFYKIGFYNVNYVVASFFSKPTDDIDYMMSIAKDGVIVMMTTDIASYELLNRKPYTKREDAMMFCKYLDEINIKYTRKDIVEENGQYLVDDNDAREFLEAFSKAEPTQVEDILKKSKLKHKKVIESISYDYFISIMKEVSIIIIEK